MSRPEEVWGDWSGTDWDQSLDPLIDSNVWGSVEDMTDESLADHLRQRAKMLDQRRPGPKILREAARRLRRGREGEGAWLVDGAVLFDADDEASAREAANETCEFVRVCRDALTTQGEPGEDEPKCSCGHDRSVHAMSYPKYRGRYCKLCPCTGYSRATKEKNHELADR